MTRILIAAVLLCAGRLWAAGTDPEAGPIQERAWAQLEQESRSEDSQLQEKLEAPGDQNWQEIERESRAQEEQSDPDLKGDAERLQELGRKDADEAGLHRGRSGVEFATGYRVDNLDFNIAHDPLGTTVPNVASELIWRSLQIYEIEGRAHVEDEHGIFAKAKLGYGWILHGNNQDSDYAGNDRTQEWSRSYSSANGGYVWDASLGVGYHVHPAEAAWSIIPLMGISFNSQVILDTNMTQVISGCFQGICAPQPGSTMSLNTTQGLHTTYNSQWIGPWNGLDMTYAAGKFRFNVGGEYHWNVTYDGYGNWNLRDDLQHPTSLKNHAKGSGYMVAGDIAYALNEHWVLHGGAQWQDWQTAPGSQTLYGANGGVGFTRLNAVHWNSASGTLGAEFRF